MGTDIFSSSFINVVGQNMYLVSQLKQLNKKSVPSMATHLKLWFNAARKKITALYTWEFANNEVKYMHSNICTRYQHVKKFFFFYFIDDSQLVFNCAGLNVSSLKIYKAGILLKYSSKVKKYQHFCFGFISCMVGKVTTVVTVFKNLWLQ